MAEVRSQKTRFSREELGGFIRTPGFCRGRQCVCEPRLTSFAEWLSILSPSPLQGYMANAGAGEVTHALWENRV